MRLSARSFRPQAWVNSFAGVYDIKSGSEIILMFGLLNKVAGVYGLISILTGGDLNFTQISFYVYSVASLVLLIWGLKAVAEESSIKTLQLSHLYALDHLLQSLYTLSFASTYYYHTPHDGRRVINSQAQREMIELAISRHEVEALSTGVGAGGGGHDSALAERLWKEEKGSAALVLAVCWWIKIYFIIVLYSYCAHLRSNTYHSLPLSTSKSSRANKSTPSVGGGQASNSSGDDGHGDEDLENELNSHSPSLSSSSITPTASPFQQSSSSLSRNNPNLNQSIPTISVQQNTPPNPTFNSNSNSNSPNLNQPPTATTSTSATTGSSTTKSNVGNGNEKVKVQGIVDEGSVETEFSWNSDSEDEDEKEKNKG